MKYIISESKLESSIYSYLDEMFDFDIMNSTNPYDYDYESGEEGPDENRVEFYLGDYDFGDGTCFRWYGCEYFNERANPRNFCPTVTVENEYSNTLNGYFGDLWHEPFKKWFTLHFDLPIKTVNFLS